MGRACSFFMLILTTDMLNADKTGIWEIGMSYLAFLCWVWRVSLATACISLVLSWSLLLSVEFYIGQEWILVNCMYLFYLIQGNTRTLRPFRARADRLPRIVSVDYGGASYGGQIVEGYGPNRRAFLGCTSPLGNG